MLLYVKFSDPPADLLPTFSNCAASIRPCQASIHVASFSLHRDIFSKCLAASVKEFILKLYCCVMVSGGKNLTRIKKINSFSPTKTTSVLTPAFPGDFGHFDKQLLQFLLNWWGFPSPDNFITAGAHYEAVNYSEKSWYYLSNWHPSTPLLL